MIQLCLNLLLKVIVFEVFCVSSRVPLHVSLFRYFCHLKKYGDWFSFSSRHCPLSHNLPSTNSVWKGKVCSVDSNSVCLPNILGYMLDLDEKVPLTSNLYRYHPLFTRYCRKHVFFPKVVLALCGMSPIWNAREETPILSINCLGM